ncbi:transposase [Streptomyces sp. NPDC088246]|uniref:transposase n=1 Tax=Streptomyces sp. NPDC088246 TaxID=3365842 RepID=UPI003801C768
MARRDLTDELWAALEPLLPKGKKPGQPPTWTRRQLIDGIRFRVRTGIPWRSPTAKPPPWPTCPPHTSTPTPHGSPCGR